MACGHCVNRITQAVRAIDQGAQGTVDLATHRGRIEPTVSIQTEFSAANREAGRTPLPTDDQPAPADRSAPRSGCCR